ncbi:hypothetical protein [Mycobacterium sp.]|jgi:hypothetical protein|uniref:hypothetical protein n=1 Tax=Mycobacterium sp. TaxID=1785 RepID=UPI002BA99AA7|nr:hypothetical protein [Mycobacterium sp.]HTH88269.1 hypothetical protein [Mycobacterium sp.]
MTDTSKPTVDVLEATQKFGEQLVSTVKQTQSLVLDAARAFAGALPSAPSGLSDNLGFVALPDVQAVTAYSFDLAAELLAAQKDFAVTLVGTCTPEKTAE